MSSGSTRASAGLAGELRLGVMRLRRRLIAERDPRNDLSIGAMAVMGGLFREGEMTLGALAARERVQPPSMTRTVNCLVTDGYVERTPHPTDGRQVVVRLTEQGRAAVLADRARRDEWLAVRLAALSADDREALRRAAPILQRLAQSD
ncbi:MAG: MarR family transcriptional regulator [Nocardioidaceae bacterium]|nr:MarR family transcriptional regulator [Nocardioidaceae bacterium]MCL2612056.1 MarR family transcriptional regulator [Nocardioidaceae bacterium]